MAYFTDEELDQYIKEALMAPEGAGKRPNENPQQMKAAVDQLLNQYNGGQQQPQQQAMPQKPWQRKPPTFEGGLPANGASLINRNIY